MLAMLSLGLFNDSSLTSSLLYGVYRGHIDKHTYEILEAKPAKYIISTCTERTVLISLY